MQKKFLKHCRAGAWWLFGFWVGYAVVLLFADRTSAIVFSQGLPTTDAASKIRACRLFLEKEEINDEILALIIRAAEENEDYHIDGFAKIRLRTPENIFGEPDFFIDFALTSSTRWSPASLFAAEQFSRQREKILYRLYSDILRLVEEKGQDCDVKNWKQLLSGPENDAKKAVFLSEFLPRLIFQDKETGEDLQWLSEQKNCVWKILFLSSLSKWNTGAVGCASRYYEEIVHECAEYFLHDECPNVRSVAESLTIP